ncbi:hypothetical protein TeGR_g7614 [Tetraparma gracilis]|uniref:RING-type domain-containing protein n=1 Tax=Tetraparma gracilis TaxID=2962635 RepID=A0ABQ6MV95_9STRA|nr:hypothetical protein TeGR_g7614 [Tetraparma gracilis]
MTAVTPLPPANTPLNPYARASLTRRTTAASFVNSILSTTLTPSHPRAQHIDFYNLANHEAEEEDEAERPVDVASLRPEIERVAGSTVAGVLARALAPRSGTGRVGGAGGLEGAGDKEDGAVVRPGASTQPLGAGLGLGLGLGSENTPLSTPLPTPRQPRATPIGKGLSSTFGRDQGVRTPFSSLINKEIQPTSVTATNMKKKLGDKEREIEVLKKQLEEMEMNMKVAATPKRTEKDEYEEELANECPLCMSPLKKKKGADSDGETRYLVTTHCGHTFHLDCLQSTKAADMVTCPMCRSDLPSGITPAKKNKPDRPTHQPARYTMGANPGRVAAAPEDGARALFPEQPHGLEGVAEGAPGEEDAAIDDAVAVIGGRGAGAGGRGNTRSKACVIS